MNCGTRKGYDQHKAANTPPCKWCVKAVTDPAPPVKRAKKAQPPRTLANGRRSRAKPPEERKRMGRPGGPPPPCGTYAAVIAHGKRGEPVDAACVQARREYRRDLKARKKAAEQ